MQNILPGQHAPLQQNSSFSQHFPEQTIWPRGQHPCRAFGSSIATQLSPLSQQLSPGEKGLGIPQEFGQQSSLMAQSVMHPQLVRLHVACAAAAMAMAAGHAGRNMQPANGAAASALQIPKLLAQLPRHVLHDALVVVGCLARTTDCPAPSIAGVDPYRFRVGNRAASALKRGIIAHPRRFRYGRKTAIVSWQGMEIHP
jgi:hypothetical protein